MTVAQVSSQVRVARREVDRRSGEARSVAAQGKQVQQQIAELREKAALYEKVVLLLNSIGEERQVGAQRKIEGLVTMGLQTIFGEELSFHLVSSETSKAASVDFMVRSVLSDGSHVDTPVMEARGGGLAATVGFLIRLVVLLLSRKQETVLFLDETFAMVSEEYLERLSEFLRELVDKTGVQIVMVTHQTALSEHADKLYRFQLVDGVTRIAAVLP